MTDLLLALVLLAVAIGVVLAVHGVGRAVRMARGPLERPPFLSGAVPVEHAVSRFHVRWYVVGMVFVAFDMEMVFMYAWTLVVRATGVGSVVEMFAFLAVLLAGVLYAWREGAFRWT